MQGNTMKRWLGVGAVVVIALGIVVFRSGQSVSPARTAKSSPSAAPATQPGPSVLLVADLGEAEESCGCGEIIRLVRHAEKHGVRIREVAPGAALELERQYRVTVAPTVLFLDGAGHEVARHEGESPAVVDSIRAGLDRLPVNGR